MTKSVSVDSSIFSATVPILGLDKKLSEICSEPLPSFVSSWSDERMGVWTTIEFTSNSVLVNERSRLWASAVAFALFSFVVLGVSFSESFGFGIAVLVFGVCYFGYWRISRIRRELFSLTIVHSNLSQQVTNEKTISTTDVLSIIVRENSNRNHVEDDQLAQVYLELANHTFVLIYQCYYRRRVDAIEVAKKLQSYISGSISRKNSTEG